MALNDVWMVTFFQTFFDTGEEMLSNYFYTSLDPTANAVTLAAAFTDPVDGMVKWINDLQCAQVDNKNLRIINLGSLTDFSDTTVGGGGAIPGDDCLPIHDAISFTMKLNTRAIRPGGKRISGVPEGDVTNGIVTGVGYIGAISAFEQALAVELVEADATWLPCVVKRIGLPLGVPPYTSYRLPESDGELVIGTVVAALANLKVSHQVSRGNGR